MMTKPITVREALEGRNRFVAKANGALDDAKLALLCAEITELECLILGSVGDGADPNDLCLRGLLAIEHLALNEEDEAVGTLDVLAVQALKDSLLRLAAMAGGRSSYTQEAR